MSSVSRLRREAAMAKRGSNINGTGNPDHTMVISGGFAVKRGTPSQKRLGVSELDQNWRGRLNLSSKESDLQYKYHVARLSNVYRGGPTIDNKPPRYVKDPPRWSTQQEELSPGLDLTRQIKREQCWDDRFYVPEDTSNSTNKNNRPRSATLVTTQEQQNGTSESKPRSQRPRSAKPKLSSGALHELSEEDRLLLEGNYSFTPDQAEIYDKFTDVLAEFDVALMMKILEDCLVDAQKKTMLADYDGTELI